MRGGGGVGSTLHTSFNTSSHTFYVLNRAILCTHLKYRGNTPCFNQLLLDLLLIARNVLSESLGEVLLGVGSTTGVIGTAAISDAETVGGIEGDTGIGPNTLIVDVVETVFRKAAITAFGGTFNAVKEILSRKDNIDRLLTEPV